MKDGEIVNRVAKKYKISDVVNFTPLDLIHRIGSPLQAILYGRLFWQNFIEYKEMIFSEYTLDDEGDMQNIDNVLKSNNFDRSRTEHQMNIIEIPSLFGSQLGETTDEEDIELASLLAEVWNCRLHQLFPHRRFRVEVLRAPDAEYETSVCFFQV